MRSLSLDDLTELLVGQRLHYICIPNFSLDPSSIRGLVLIGVSVNDLDELIFRWLFPFADVLYVDIRVLLFLLFGWLSFLFQPRRFLTLLCRPLDT